jgi:hypothetical protein
VYFIVVGSSREGDDPTADVQEMIEAEKEILHADRLV